MSKMYVNFEKCKGCYLCVANCPKKAISISEHVNAKGYKNIIVDTENCILCGCCYQMCPDYVFEIK